MCFLKTLYVLSTAYFCFSKCMLTSVSIVCAECDVRSTVYDKLNPSFNHLRLSEAIVTSRLSP